VTGSGSGADGREITRDQAIRAALLATASAACFGIGLYSSGRLSTLLPVPWAIQAPRALGFILVALPLIATRRIRLSRAAAPYVIAVGLAEVIGYTFYNWGAQEAIAITAVLATLFAPLSSVAAFILFRERLATRQIAGIALVVIGVTILGAVQH